MVIVEGNTSLSSHSISIFIGEVVMSPDVQAERKAKVPALEMLSSAFTLSDMEIFIFPELLYALVLANIISPVIWGWRKDPWFKGIDKKKPIQRINRVKQFVMDNFVFNLDLETWGLTTKEREIERFRGFLSEEVIARSNALFGYEGDKHYFSIDIRRHFGLDKYTDNVIPYWKTETVEAMNAFRYKGGYTTGAGECVSLSTLYTAALFLVAKIPLDKIFLMATPLHSQNFIDVNDGVLTNNRRIVTKNMWTNGTSLSTKARRALENEDVTVVSHISGNIHTVYREASIDPDAYNYFATALSSFLRADLKPEVISNFIRKESEFQRCFQYRHSMHGKEMYIEVEKIYKYEHTSPNSFSTDSRATLLNEIDDEEFSFTPIPDRIMLNDFEEFLRSHPDLSIEDLDVISIRELEIEKCPNIERMFKSLKEFLLVIPRLPGMDKEFKASERLEIPLDWPRERVIEYIRCEAERNLTTQLALYAYRDMERIDWVPFVKAAVERNPVCLTGLEEKSVEEIRHVLDKMENESIYDETRLALPDEVWNYGRGDGLEKAFLMVNVLLNRHPNEVFTLNVRGKDVTIESKIGSLKFISNKGLWKRVTMSSGEYRTV